MAVKCNTKYLANFIRPEEYAGMQHLVCAAHQTLHEKSGLGNDFLGWVDLPTNYDKAEFERIKAAAKKIQQQSKVLVVIGIGGSYLGARAAIEYIKSNNYNALAKDTPQVYFVGNTISPSYLNDILAICEGVDFSVNVISKSGTTTEPALAFRVFKELLEKRYGPEGAKERIYSTTDKARGTLKELSDRNGYETFVIPDDVGGRYSVLTPVGLLPIAVAGCDIDAVMAGAKEAQDAFTDPDLDKNDCYKYAAVRNILYNKGYSIEIMASYEPSYGQMNEWFKQLYGESEGKDHKALYPSSVIFSTDLHSMGQYIQDGRRQLFETVIDFAEPKSDFFIPEDPENLDGLNFLSGQNMSNVNKKAMQGTILAHVKGGVPNAVLQIDKMDAHSFGYLVYFLEKACAISGYLLGVNPFDQPGVESYKKNMFALLGKPGYEDLREELVKEIQE